MFISGFFVQIGGQWAWIGGRPDAPQACYVDEAIKAACWIGIDCFIRNGVAWGRNRHNIWFPL